jgi:hypothetical protein
LTTDQRGVEPAAGLTSVALTRPRS